jgi:hypothetical protein
MKKLASIAAALLVAAPLTAWAAGGINLRVETSGDLAELCGANPKEAAADAKINFCHGFAQGVLDVERKYAGDKKKFCFPSKPPTRTETMGEFANWVRALPAHKTLGPVDGLFQFLGERFPCK